MNSRGASVSKGTQVCGMSEESPLFLWHRATQSKTMENFWKLVSRRDKARFIGSQQSGQDTGRCGFVSGSAIGQPGNHEQLCNVTGPVLSLWNTHLHFLGLPMRTDEVVTGTQPATNGNSTKDVYSRSEQRTMSQHDSGKSCPT